MFPGGRAPDPRQMKAMMRKMGIDQKELEGVEQVVIITRDREIVFTAPEVVAVTAQGVTTYQVAGNPVERPRGAGGAPAGVPAKAGAPPARAPKYSAEDVSLVMAQTGASEQKARAALDECNGEVAEAIIRLLG
jgi:nascent polypeptide-associated complex subunit alpha